MEKDYVKFPNFSQNVASFPNSMGPGPILKKGCERPRLYYKEVNLASVRLLQSFCKQWRPRWNAAL